MRIFFAGPLTTLEHPTETKAFYAQLGKAALEEGFATFWAFQSGTDPMLNPDVPAAAVYKTDIEQLSKSDLLVAYVGEPSIGTGEEIEYAKTNAIPVVILYRKGQAVSRMLRGNPAVKKEIVYENEAEAIDLFRAMLKELKPSVRNGSPIASK